MGAGQSQLIRVHPITGNLIKQGKTSLDKAASVISPQHVLSMNVVNQKKEFRKLQGNKGIDVHNFGTAR